MNRKKSLYAMSCLGIAAVSYFYTTRNIHDPSVAQFAESRPKHAMLIPFQEKLHHLAFNFLADYSIDRKRILSSNKEIYTSYCHQLADEFIANRNDQLIDAMKLTSILLQKNKAELQAELNASYKPVIRHHFERNLITYYEKLYI